MRLRSLLPGRGERRVLELADVAEAWSASPTAAGVSVTPENSLRLTAVYGCVRVLSEAVASLPFPVYRRQERSRVRLRDDPRWRLLNEEPNPEQTAFELWQMVMTHLNLYGNGYLAIDTTGGRLSLWPLDPRCSWPERDETTLRLRYRTRLANGDEAVIPPEAMIHVRGLVVAGDVGLSPIGVARHAIGAAVATEEYAARFFANDATPRTFISLKRHMDEEKQEEFRRKWEGGHRGLKRAHLLGVVTGDADIKTVGIPPKTRSSSTRGS